MADYGNDPTFGSYITPVNTAPQEVVALAQASERAGLAPVTAVAVAPENGALRKDLGSMSGSSRRGSRPGT